MQDMLHIFPFLELLDWYEKSGRDTLPWRDYNHDKKQLWYRVWLAETMLQQTQVERVKEYFHNILEAFPTVEDLANTSYEEFFPYYKWLGYYSRARNMLKAAKMLVDDFWWVFPTESNDLTKLPGVWPYTAEAIKAFTYNIPTLSFDTNLEKIFSRYFFGNKFRKLTKEEKNKLLSQMQEVCKHLNKLPLNSVDNSLPLDEGEQNNASFVEGGGRRSERIFLARDINNALMDYGATISLNNISWIDWKNYPFQDSEFYKTRWSLEPINEKKKSTFPNKQAYVIAVLHENHKTYFSASSNFSPFLIWINTWNPRAMTQEYFKQKHWLEVSVRPPEIKSYSALEIPYMVCYVQIQSGVHNFQGFDNIKVRGFEEGYVEKLEFGKNSLF